ncbi:hypothetical protein COT99_03450, partial [Candidatus Falkowbacteria bacterium CG10_big_fil_rev_8_21_14_0_10_43_10]
MRIGSFTITAGAGEDVDITKINIRDNGTQDLGGDFQNLRLVAGNTIGTVIAGSAIGTTIGTLQTSVAYDYEFSPVTAVRIPNGNKLIVDVYADVLTNAADTATSFVGVKLYSVTATGVSTSASAGETSNESGQSVYIAASGTLTIENVPTSSQVQANIVNSSDTGSNEVELYKFKLTALTEAIDVTRFIITDTIVSTTYSATETNGKPTTSITNFKLFDGATQIGGIGTLYGTSTPTNGGYIDFNLGTGHEFIINAGGEKVITLKGLVNTFAYISSGATHKFSLDADPIEDDTTNAVVARGHDSSADKSGPASTLNGNEITVRRSYPVVTRENLPSSTLSPGSTDGATATVSKFKVTAVGGEIRLKKMTFSVTISDTTTSTALSLSNFRLFRNGVQIGNSEYDIYDGTGTAAADELSPGGTATLSTLKLNNSLGTKNGATETTTSTRMILVFSTTAELAGGGDGEGEEVISTGGTNTYEIKADIANAHRGTPATDSDSIVV